MLQHDALYHYGVRGMKWGVRRYAKALGTSVLDGAKHPKEQEKAFAESIKNTQGKAAKVRRTTLYSKTSEIEDMNRRTARMVGERKQRQEKDQAEAMKLARKIDEGAARRKADRKAKMMAKITNTPYKPDRNQYRRNVSTFEKTLTGAGVGVVTALTIAALSPTAKAIGQELAKKVVTKVVTG